VTHRSDNSYLIGAPDAGTFFYGSKDDAGKAVLELLNPISIRTNLEYGGLILSTPDGQYVYTDPTKGKSDEWEAGFLKPKELDSYNYVGIYHTHGGHAAPSMAGRYYNDPNIFSAQDIAKADELNDKYNGFTSYLGTPNGINWEYDPLSGLKPFPF
jgi:hypothetical protein